MTRVAGSPTELALCLSYRSRSGREAAIASHGACRTNPPLSSISSVRPRPDNPRMAHNFIACDRDQPMLLPPDLRDWLPEDHLAWQPLELPARDVLGQSR